MRIDITPKAESIEKTGNFKGNAEAMKVDNSVAEKIRGKKSWRTGSWGVSAPWRVQGRTKTSDRRRKCLGARTFERYFSTHPTSLPPVKSSPTLSEKHNHSLSPSRRLRRGRSPTPHPLLPAARRARSTQPQAYQPKLSRKQKRSRSIRKMDFSDELLNMNPRVIAQRLAKFGRYQKSDAPSERKEDKASGNKNILCNSDRTKKQMNVFGGPSVEGMKAVNVEMVLIKPEPNMSKPTALIAKASDASASTTSDSQDSREAHENVAKETESSGENMSDPMTDVSSGTIASSCSWLVGWFRTSS